MNHPGKNKMSQTDQIIAYLKTGGVLTRLKGLQLFNTISLNSRMSDIRKRGVKGYRIETRTITTNTGKHVAEYKLVKDGELGLDR